MKLITFLTILALLSYYSNCKAESPSDPGNDAKFNSGKTECEYNGFALQTSVSLPLVRYNFAYHKSDNGTLEYFNAAGGGIALNYGKIHIKSSKDITDANTLSNDFETDMSNYLGFGAGFIFSSNKTSAQSSKASFAPIFFITFLNFQVGAGYEAGDRIEPSSRFFCTVTLDIPLLKLTNTGSYILSPIESGGTVVHGSFLAK